MRPSTKLLKIYTYNFWNLIDTWVNLWGSRIYLSTNHPSAFSVTVYVTIVWVFLKIINLSGYHLCSTSCKTFPWQWNDLQTPHTSKSEKTSCPTIHGECNAIIVVRCHLLNTSRSIPLHIVFPISYIISVRLAPKEKNTETDNGSFRFVPFGANLT